MPTSATLKRAALLRYSGGGLGWGFGVRSRARKYLRLVSRPRPDTFPNYHGREKNRLAVAAALLIALVLSSPLLACPFCRDSIPNHDPSTATVESAAGSFNHSIYFMLGGLVVAGGIVTRACLSCDPSGPVEGKRE